VNEPRQFPSSEVVICTRGRAGELQRCLQSVMSQSVARLTVFVVDGSDDDASRAVVEEARATAPLQYQLKYVRTDPGLARQRNAAVEALEPFTEYVCFLDDDTVIDREYIAAIEQAFRADEYAGVVGMGGLIQNPPPRPYRALRSIFLLDSTRNGAVLPSGVNVQVQDPDGPTYVDWISGCAMNFRRAIFREFRFDSAMQDYSLGEDLEFTFRLSRRYKLLVNPDAHVWHLRAAAERDDEVGYAREQIRFRYRFVRSHPDELSLVAFGWCCFGEILQNLTYLSPRRLRRQFKRALGIMLGLWDIARFARA
jgi:GT2 family glycosyltransferase